MRALPTIATEQIIKGGDTETRTQRTADLRFKIAQIPDVVDVAKGVLLTPMNGHCEVDVKFVLEQCGQLR
jgi:hypothetical protein